MFLTRPLARRLPRRGTVAVLTAVCLAVSMRPPAIAPDRDPLPARRRPAQGGGVTTVQGTPIVVNSNNAEAAIGGGGGVLKADEFDITGGYTTTGGGTFNGPIYTGRAPMPDPLADLPPPDPTTMSIQSAKK